MSKSITEEKHNNYVKEVATLHWLVLPEIIMLLADFYFVTNRLGVIMKLIDHAKY